MTTLRLELPAKPDQQLTTSADKQTSIFARRNARFESNWPSDESSKADIRSASARRAALVGMMITARRLDSLDSRKPAHCG